MASGAETKTPDYIPPIERLVPPELAGLRLDQALARLFPEHSRTRLQTWVRDGRVTVDAARFARLEDGSNETPVAQKTLSAMIEIQPWRASPEAYSAVNDPAELARIRF